MKTKSIELYQLVRITGIHSKDASKTSESMFIGKTGYFVPNRDGIKEIDLGSWEDGTYFGDFIFEPDELEHNPLNPCFYAVYVEPVETV